MANATANELKQIETFDRDVEDLTKEFISKESIIKLSNLHTIENLKNNEALKEFYGKVTDFTSVEGVEWKLFYDDEDYYYLIASDIENNKFTQRYLKWPLQEGYRSCQNANAKATAYMMDTSKWSSFAGPDVIQRGGFAIGGPMVEMFAKSYYIKYCKNNSNMLL